MMPKWNIGDRVVCIESHPDGNQDIIAGSTGTVCVISRSTGRIGVNWDEPIERGHVCVYDAKGWCESGHGWWVHGYQIEPELDDDTEFEFDEEEFNKLVFGK